MKVAEKKVNFTPGFFLFLLRSNSVLKGRLAEEANAKNSICRTRFLCILVSLAHKTGFPLASSCASAA